MKTYLLTLSITLCSTFFVTSCKDDEPVAKDEDILATIAADSIFDILNDLGQDINKGTTPPSMENTYLVTPYVLINSNRTNDEIGKVYGDLKFQILEQNNKDLSLQFISEQAGGVGDAKGGFIIGSDNMFTILLDVVTKYSYYQDSIRVLTTYSGQFSESGIINLQTSLTVTDDFGDPYDRFIAIGDTRLFDDHDAFSEEINEELSNQRIIKTGWIEELVLSTN